MTISARIDRRSARLLIAGVLTLLIAVALTLPAAPAEAESQVGRCSTAYNYADASSGYLYASTTADWRAYPEPCFDARVEIRNGGCSGQVLASASDGDDGNLDFVASTSYTLASRHWNKPCSYHQADWERMWLRFGY